MLYDQVQRSNKSARRENNIAMKVVHARKKEAEELALQIHIYILPYIKEIPHVGFVCAYELYINDKNHSPDGLENS